MRSRSPNTRRKRSGGIVTPLRAFNVWARTRPSAATIRIQAISCGDSRTSSSSTVSSSCGSDSVRQPRSPADGQSFPLRLALRFLPHQHVRDVAVSDDCVRQQDQPEQQPEHNRQLEKEIARNASSLPAPTPRPPPRAAAAAKARTGCDRSPETASENRDLRAARACAGCAFEPEASSRQFTARRAASFAASMQAISVYVRT